MEPDSFLKTIYPEEIYSFLAPVTVVIGVAWDEIKDEQRLLLSKILQAVGLSLESVRIIHQASFDLASFHEKPRKLIAFASPPKGLSTYEVIQTGETSVIFSEPLEILVSDEAAKRKLWNTLRTLFPA